jgi:glycerol-3-phosphate dehydrogenase (NAD(P)+)
MRASDNEANESLSIHHERIRRRGVNRSVYWVVRAFLQPFLMIFFRLTRLGREHLPGGGLILAANHRSFLDPFLIGCCVRRPIYFVAKQELFANRLQGWFLNCLGAFPVRRGESDEESVATALALLERGEAVVIFPEGTRIRHGSVDRPKRGVGRLALESGAPVVPVAVTGSEHARRGWIFRPVKVKVRCGRPLTFPRADEVSPALAEAVTNRIWPCVQLQWEWLGGLPPLRTAAIVGAGSMGTAMAVLLQRAGLEVQLGCRSIEQARRVAAEGENSDHLPGVPLDPKLRVTTVSDIEFAGADLVVLAVPCSGLPAALARVGALISDRSAVLVPSKGLVPPLGTTPAAYVAERTRARAVAYLGGPAHAREAVEDGASVVLATRDPDVRRDLGALLSEAGLCVDTTEDVTGAELAGCAKNAAALAAAAAAAAAGPNVAGAAAGRVFAEVHELGLREGALSATFAGLAGAGDLVATTMAEGSRNRRAGELVGLGVTSEAVPGIVGQTAEALAAVPLLDATLRERGVEAPVTAGLCTLLEGGTTPDDWVETFRRPRQGRRPSRAA